MTPVGITSKLKIIKGCYHSCPFFGVESQVMVCNHPYWEEKEAYENMIITQDNSRDGKIPEKCPLRDNDLIVQYTLNL